MDKVEGARETSALIFLGTGCSGCVPSARCLIRPTDPPCPVCSESLKLPPHQNPNYRCNTSLLIDYCGRNGTHNYILIDVGKTFREQVLRWFTFYKIPRIDSVLLTHEHADAVLGLDDLHYIQQFSTTSDMTIVPIYGTKECENSVLSRFPSLDKKNVEQVHFKRQSVHMDWNVIEENCEKPFIASGLQFYPLPVLHGEDYVALGFLFGEKQKAAYVSDVSQFPSTTEYAISNRTLGKLHLLILDSNRLISSESPSNHLSFQESLDAVKKISPKFALLTGMTHDYDHFKINAYLKGWSEREGIQVQLAHDGLRIPMDL